MVITADDLDRLYSELFKSGRRSGPNKGSPLSVTTIKHIHGTVGKALADAMRKNRISRNVAQAATLPKRRTVKKKMKVWTEDELRKFLDAVRDQRLYAAFYVAASTGMRRGEVLGLHWEDIDLDKAVLTVAQSLVQVNKDVKLQDPKNDKTRSVSLDAETVGILRAWKKQQLEERLAIGPAYVDSGLVFTTLEGSSLKPSSFSQTFDRLVARTGLPKIRLHDLRHTHATLLLGVGVPTLVVSERLGHATPGFTLTVYGHLLPGQDSDAAERFGELLRGAQ